MNKKFFAGSDAVDSILKIARSTNVKLIDKAKRINSASYADYEPWMSIPEFMKPSQLILKLPSKKGRFLNSSSLIEIDQLLKSLGQGHENIPSKESYNLRVCLVNKDELDHFNSRLKDAEDELILILPFFESLIHELIQFYIPMENPSDEHAFDYGMSVMWLKGAVFFEKTQFPDLQRRVENLAHELAHQIIIHYQLNNFLIEGDLNTKVYSGIRKKNRPAVLSFHGAAALSYMLLVAKAYSNQERMNELKTALRNTLDSLKGVSFTPVGNKLFEEMHEFL